MFCAEERKCLPTDGIVQNREFSALLRVREALVPNTSVQKCPEHMCPQYTRATSQNSEGSVMSKSKGRKTRLATSRTASRGVQWSPASSLFYSTKRRSDPSKMVPMAWLSRLCARLIGSHLGGRTHGEVAGGHEPHYRESRLCRNRNSHRGTQRNFSSCLNSAALGIQTRKCTGPEGTP